MSDFFDSFDDSSVHKLDEEYLSLSVEDRKKWVENAKKECIESAKELREVTERLKKEGFFEKNKMD